MTSPDLERSTAIYDAEMAEIEQLRDYQQTLRALIAEAIDFSRQAFDSMDDAEDAGTVFIDEWALETEYAKDESPDDRLRVTGKEIQIPSFDLIREESSTMIFVDEDEPMKPLEYPLTQDGIINYFHRTAVPAGDGKYRGLISIVLAVKESPKFAVKHPLIPVDVIEGLIKANAIVPLNETTHIEVIELEEREKQMQAMREIARSGLAESLLIRTLTDIVDEMSNSDPDEEDYLTLENPDRLKLVSHRCIDYVNNGICSQEMLTNVLLSVFQRGRRIVVSRNKDGYIVDDDDNTAEGQVEHLYFVENDEGIVTGVNIAIAVEEDADGKKPVKNFALNELEAIHY